MLVGYFVIILPDQRLWQGIPIPHLDSTPEYIQSIRASLTGSVADPQNFISNPPPHVPLDDVPTLGVLQALTVKGVIESDMQTVISASSGITHLMGSDFFWLSGRVANNGAVSTTFASIPVGSIEEAQEVAPYLPPVIDVGLPSGRSAYGWQ